MTSLSAVSPFDRTRRIVDAGWARTVDVKNLIQKKINKRLQRLNNNVNRNLLNLMPTAVGAE